MLLGSTASAAIFVHAGPVRVAVARPYYRHYAHVRPVIAAPLAPLPVVAPVAPVVAPLPPAVLPGAALTPAERAEIRETIRGARNAVRNAVLDAARD
jgi:hypothetical protein